MSSIETIFKAGDDALGNLWEINFSPISFLPNLDDLKVRVTEVSIPEYTVGVYTVEYKTQKFEKPSGKIETPNQFTFTLRADKYWTLYTALNAWHQFIADNENGAMAEDVGAITGESGIRTDITVIPTDSNNIPTGVGWKFHKAFPVTVPGVEFSMGNGEPIELQITMSFLKMTMNA